MPCSIVARVTPIIVRRDGTSSETPDIVVREKAITVFVGGREITTLTCTPEYVQELVVGFLYTEGFLPTLDALTSLVLDMASGTAHAEIAAEPLHRFRKRHFAASRADGSPPFYFASDAALCRRMEGEGQLEAETAFRLMEALEARSRLFRRTGGVHCAAVADRTGRFLSYYEDVARQNTLDKLMGAHLLAGQETEGNIVVFSGRVSAEVVLKVAKLRCPILIAKSAPNELGLQMADALGMTVIGFAKRERFNLYTHPERIATCPGAALDLENAM
ncbi:MAG: formate dehydrogenase accessory sulfurtransferase FdhD [Oscillospiraceae bacterium]|nr:formate dehydrogenase accessory sulfurtransferase FdhD [Oscillospiraceae bacterium]